MDKQTDEFRPDEDIVNAVKQFNNDFHYRCMQQDMIEDAHRHNIDALNKMKDDIRESCITATYDFWDDKLKGDLLRKSIDNMFHVYSKDPTITEEINHTGFPDDTVIMLIALNTGTNVLSIRDFSSVDAVWHNDEHKVGYMFNVKLACSTIVVDIDISGKIKEVVE